MRAELAALFLCFSLCPKVRAQRPSVAVSTNAFLESLPPRKLPKRGHYSTNAEQDRGGMLDTEVTELTNLP